MEMFKGQANSEAHGWMVYGATGRLGELIIQKALAQGLTPVMGGRSIARLRAMADKYQLPWRLVDLDQPEQAAKALSGIDFVYSAAVESTVPGLVNLCQAVGAHLLLPHQLTEQLQRQVDDTVSLVGQGAAVITGAGFHTAATESLLSIAQRQPYSTEFSALHVALLGLPFAWPGYTRAFLGRLKTPVDAIEGQGSRARGQQAWYQVLLKEMAMHPEQTWRGLGGKSLRGMRWWAINAPERLVAQRYFAHTPLSVYLPVAPWLLPVLKHFSGMAVGVLEPVLGRAAQMGVMRQNYRAREKDAAGLLNNATVLATQFAAQLVTRQGADTSRTAVWLVAQRSDGQYARFGIEFPSVYEMVSSLAVVLARDLLGNPVAVRRDIAMTLVPGVQTSIECFGADVVLAVPDTLRFGALKKVGLKASVTVSNTVVPTESVPLD